jgi:hypothetical protein
MSIKSNLESLYNKLPSPIIQFLSPKSNEYQIKQGQKYAQTEFINSQTGERFDYCQMLELHTAELHADYRKSISTNYHLFMAVSYSFETFTKGFIQIEKRADEQSIQHETGSVEALMEGMQRIRATLTEFGIDSTNPEEQPKQDPFDNSPYDSDIYHN